MKDISLKELVDLVVAEVTEAESYIEKMFEWYFERDITLTKWLLGAAASITVAVVLAIFRNQAQLASPYTILIVLCAGACFLVGIYRFVQLRKVHKQFVSTLKLYRDLQNIGPFINVYRRTR